MFFVPDGVVWAGLNRFVPVAAATSRGGTLRGFAGVPLLWVVYKGLTKYYFKEGAKFHHFKAPRFNRPEPVRAGLDGGGFDKVK